MARSLRWRSERHALPGEVQSLGPGVDGAIAARVGRGGGPGGRTWRHHGGSARHGDRVLHDSTRPPGVGCATPRRPAADSAPRRRPQENAGEGSDPADRPRRVGGADRVGTSPVAAPLDVEERASPDGGAPAHGASMATGTTLFIRSVDGSNSFTYFLTPPKGRAGPVPAATRATMTRLDGRRARGHSRRSARPAGPGLRRRRDTARYGIDD